MKSISAGIFFVLISGTAWALTAGPQNCTAGADDSAVGTQAWSGTSINDGCTSNNTRVTATVTSTETTHYYRATGFDFSAIGDSDTINGIQVHAEIACASNGSNNLDQLRIRLINGNGTIQVTDRAVAGTDWPATDTVVTFGGTSDLWNDNAETWTPVIVKDSDFGVAIAGIGETSSGTKTVNPTIDNVAITITYTAARRRIISITSNAEADRANPFMTLGKIAAMHAFFIPFWFSSIRREP